MEMLIRYEVPVIWKMSGYVSVLASSKEEAIKYAKIEAMGVPPNWVNEFSRDHGEYVEDSMEIGDEAMCLT